MSEYNKKILDELIMKQLDISEINNSKSFQEIESQIEKLEKIIIEKLDEQIFSEYRELRIDIETLYYKFGFIECLKSCQSLLMTSTKDIIDDLNQNN